MFDRFKRGALTFALSVSSSMAVAAAVSPVTPPNAAGSLAGTIAGQATVSSRGASEYSFQIAVPPGTAGMVPSLSMSYDSENQIDIGGLGWSLNGLTTITRCKRTLATDGFVHAVDLTAGDAYCLNGQRLIKINGTDGTNAEYRTEVETFQRVKSFGSNAGVGPDHWTVETRDGRILTVGGIGNSTVPATKQASPINWVWMVQRVQDQRGNYMTYQYESTGTGEYFPTQIVYTGNSAAGLVPYNAVDFIYESRSDVFSGRVSDVLVTRPNRLKQIRTRIGISADTTGGSVVRQWNFAYTYSPYSNRSLLQSVKDCNGDGSQCLPATTFAWTQRDTSKNTLSAPGSGTWSGPGIQIQSSYAVGSGSYTPAAQFAKRAVIGDFNGDGKKDILTNVAGSTTWQYCPSTGTAFSCTSLTGMPSASSENFFVGDFNGDGLSDVLVSMGANQPWYLCLSTGTGFNCSVASGLPAAIQYINTQFTPLIGDFNGDGRDDILFKGTLCNSTGAAFTCATYNSSVYGMWDTAPANPQEYTYASVQTLADFDGDGQVDILASQASSEMDPNCTITPTLTCRLDSTAFYRYTVAPGGLLLTSTGADHRGAYLPNDRNLSDLNGDGVSDLIFEGSVQRHSANGTLQPATYYMNTCVGGTICTYVSNQSTDLMAGLIRQGDYLQTGATVGLYSNSGPLYSIPFNADGSQPAANTTMPWVTSNACSSAVGSLQIDVDGDGLPDQVCYTPSAYPSTTGTWNVSLTGTGSFPDRLQSVIDGNRLTTSWSYTSGNNASVVAPGALATYPLKNVHVTAPVVYKMSVNADSALHPTGTLDTTYKYRGMRQDLRGRGSMGFDLVTSTEVAADGTPGVTTSTQYSQSFPTVAREVAVTKTSGGVTLSSETLTWASFNTQSGLSVLYPYTRRQVTSGQELDGTSLPLMTKQVGTQASAIDGIDAYGNVLSQTSTSTENNGAGDAYLATTQCVNADQNQTSAYDNRVGAQWLLGLCQRSVQTVSPDPKGLGSRVVTSNFDSYGALQTSTSMPGTALALTTSYGRDINTGSPLTVGQAWTDPLDLSAKSRTTTTGYDLLWRFPVTVKNALGQTLSFAYDSATGAQTNVIDYNSLGTHWAIDAWGRKTEEDRADGTWANFYYLTCVDTCGSFATHVDVVRHWAPGGVQMLSPEETLYDSHGRKLLYRTWNDANTEADTAWSYGDTGDLYVQALPKYVTEATSGATTFSNRDVLHRPTRVDRSNAQGTGYDTTLYTYSALIVRTTDANSHNRSEYKNGLGRVKKVTDHNGQSVLYTYDGFGNLLSTQDPVNNVVSIGYDVMGHKVSMSDPDLGNRSYIVDALGRTRRQSDSKSQVATFTFDLLDRQIQRIEADQESDWIFDTATYGVGKIAESFTKNQSGTRDYDRVHQYDSLSREIRDTLSLDADYSTLTSYNAYGLPGTLTHRRNAIGQTDSAAQVVHTLDYNVRGAMKSLQRDGVTVWTLNYDDAAGRNRQETIGNGFLIGHGYNLYTALLESIKTGTDDGSHGVTPTIQNDAYTYDPVGNLLTRSNWDNGAVTVSETLTYDELNRLKSSTVSGQAQQAFAYDALGNMTSKTGLGTYSYPTGGGARPHLVSSIAGSVVGLSNPTFSYDANGNLQNGLNRYYTWTAANYPAAVDRLTAAGVAAGSYPQSSNLRYTFSYGPERDRTKQTIQVVSGGSPVSMNSQMFTAAGIEKEVDFLHNVTKVRTYMPAGIGFTEEDIPGTANAANSTAARRDFYYVKDNLGSPEIIFQGQTYQRMAYDAWGRRRNTSGAQNAWSTVDQSGLANSADHKGYTDQEELDELSLIHLNGRIYDPLTSRFVSPDPTIPDLFDLQSLNRASYVLNSPMDKTDPTGFTTTVTGSFIARNKVDDINRDASRMGVNVMASIVKTPPKAAAANTSGAQPTATKSEAPTKADGKDASTGKNTAAVLPLILVGPAEAGSGLVAATPPGLAIGASLIFCEVVDCSNPVSNWVADKFWNILHSDGESGRVPPQVGPGPNAGESVPVGPTARPTREEQEKINEIGNRTGCHSCGSETPGTKSGNWVGDHQDPTKLNPPGKPQRYYPQCRDCSNEQGGRIRWLPPAL